jgi:hypothetical protein
MKRMKKTCGAAGKDARETPQTGTFGDADFNLRMGHVGKSVKLLWPDNIESILSSDKCACLTDAIEVEEVSMDKQGSDSTNSGDYRLNQDYSIESILSSDKFAYFTGAIEFEEAGTDKQGSDSANSGDYRLNQDYNRSTGVRVPIPLTTSPG